MVSLAEYQQIMKKRRAAKSAPKKRAAAKKQAPARRGLTLAQYEEKMNAIDGWHGFPAGGDDAPDDGGLAEGTGESESVVLSEDRGRPLGTRRKMTVAEYRAKLDAIEKRYL